MLFVESENKPQVIVTVKNEKNDNNRIVTSHCENQINCSYEIIDAETPKVTAVTFNKGSNSVTGTITNADNALTGTLTNDNVHIQFLSNECVVQMVSATEFTCLLPESTFDACGQSGTV